LPERVARVSARHISPQARALINVLHDVFPFVRLAAGRILAHERVSDVKLATFIGECIAHHKSVAIASMTIPQNGNVCMHARARVYVRVCDLRILYDKNGFGGKQR
jgi:hypothetical protein